MKAKIVFHNGVLHGVFLDKEAKMAGLELDIVDGDSDCDFAEATQYELENPDMEFVDVSVRHPKMPE